MEIDAIASVGQVFKKNDIPVPLPRCRKKQSNPVPRKTKLNEKEKLAEFCLTTMAKLLA
jgi:hypothetical protein